MLERLHDRRLRKPLAKSRITPEIADVRRGMLVRTRSGPAIALFFADSASG
jgi:hypothetical protein